MRQSSEQQQRQSTPNHAHAALRLVQIVIEHTFRLVDMTKLMFLFCLFASGVGVGMTRDPATLMIGQYFKRKRELVEIILVSASGFGIATMSVFIRTSIK